MTRFIVEDDMWLDDTTVQHATVDLIGMGETKLRQNLLEAGVPRDAITYVCVKETWGVDENDQPIWVWHLAVRGMIPHD
jgi:hypothetical protein